MFTSLGIFFNALINSTSTLGNGIIGSGSFLWNLFGV